MSKESKKGNLGFITNNTKQLQERKAMEESDNELTNSLFASPITLPPIHVPKKCVQRNNPELLRRQRRTTIKGNKMEENNLKLKETSQKIKETKKMAKKLEDIFGTYSGEWGNYVDLEEAYM
jgi:hydroxyethylthiazole kinase-like sugar kinase family protein